VLFRRASLLKCSEVLMLSEVILNYLSTLQGKTSMKNNHD
jgi:hypothetical protein